MKSSSAGLILAGLTAPQIAMSFMPSQSEVYKNANDPVQVELLRRGQLVGSIASVGVMALVSVIIAETDGPRAGVTIFILSLILLGLVHWEFERTLRIGFYDPRTD